MPYRDLENLEPIPVDWATIPQILTDLTTHYRHRFQVTFNACLWIEGGNRSTPNANSHTAEVGIDLTLKANVLTTNQPCPPSITLLC